MQNIQELPSIARFIGQAYSGSSHTEFLFHSGVGEDMPLQTATPGELLLTVVTLVWFLPSVGEDMPL